MTNKWQAAVRGAVLTVGALGWMTGGAWAAQYGTAVVEQGEMTILRDGRSIEHKASAEAVGVNEKDIVRVRNASRIVLKTQDRATLTLGANAVFQCEPWQANEKTGTFRMLFGRFRATVATLAGQERFNVKSATATIGVKGTEYDLATTSGGNTVVLGRENTVTNAGTDGVDQPVGPNQVSVVIGDNPATPSVTAPPEFILEMSNPDSPPVTSPGARDIPGQNILVDKGIVSKDAIDKSNSTTPPPTQPPPPPVAPSINLDDAQQAGGATKVHVNVGAQK